MSCSEEMGLACRASRTCSPRSKALIVFGPGMAKIPSRNAWRRQTSIPQRGNQRSPRWNAGFLLVQLGRFLLASGAAEADHHRTSDATPQSVLAQAQGG